jgi:two-component system, sensor histidine kinase
MKPDQPPEVYRYLVSYLLEARPSCGIVFEPGVKLIGRFGPLTSFGLSPDGSELFDMTIGVEPGTQSIIPLVQFGSGRVADLHCLMDRTPAYAVLIASEAGVSEIGVQQQAANELRMTTDRQSQTISALTQAQQLLRDSERELKRAHDLKGMFISKMSHEFGTPITAVLGRMRLLESAVIDQPSALEHLNVIKRGVLHLHQLVQSVLDEARMEQGTLRLEPTKVRLSELRTDLLDLFASQALEKSLKFEVSIASDELLWIDPLRVKQILINLISNGLKYTHEGKVALYMSWRDDKLTANITDTGPGMTRDQATSLFRPFKRLNEKGPVSGTGLGLVISRELAQHMGGNIEVRSSLGEGSSFILTLPCETCQESSPKRNAVQKVLIVDDDEDIRELLCALLDQDGMKISSAENGAVAEMQFRQHGPDVILLDMQLGTENGAHVAKRLRTLGCKAKIIALSASNSGDTSNMAINAGCDAFLGKPVNFEQLKELMQADPWIQ